MTDTWEIWYRDTFDRETPARCEAGGSGIVSGLMELWARHLFETVRLDGSSGFSRFSLQFGPDRVDIEGPLEGQVRARAWVFGTKEHADAGYVAAADADVLKRIATAHARLIQAGATSEQILAAAVESLDWNDCEKRLAR